MTAPEQPAIAGRVRAFVLTWVAYASYYLARKNFSVAKVQIGQELGMSPATLGALDTGYLIAYALGLFACGALGDRFGARKLVGLGMLVAAGACAAIGLSSTAMALGVAFVVSGLAQSSGWPGTTRAMATWTTPQDRGAVMGIWTTCYQVGGVVATAVAARLLALYGWRTAFLAPAAYVAIIGVVQLLFLRERPQRVLRAAADTPAPVAASDGAPVDASIPNSLEDLARIRRAVWRNVTLWSCAGCYFALKLIRYSLLFWLPYYLHTSLGFAPEKAGYLSIAFEVGGTAGSLGLGLLSDRMRFLPRPVWAASSVVLLGVALFSYGSLAPTSALANALLVAVIGALLFGPDAMVSGAAAQDAGGPYAAGQAAGIVNGVGSCGAILQATFTVGVSSRYGWGAVFQLCGVLAFLGALALTPAIRAALRERRRLAA